jgi:hypothetical protein
MESSESDNSSKATPVAPPPKRAFLGSFRQMPKIPKIAKLKEGAAVIQETSSRVGPSFLTVASLLWASDKGVSFLSLYTLSLLGASCGFYLFLYFISIGYALGVTLPLIAALYLYNVRIYRFIQWAR